MFRTTPIFIYFSGREILVIQCNNRVFHEDADQRPRVLDSRLDPSTSKVSQNTNDKRSKKGSSSFYSPFWAQAQGSRVIFNTDFPRADKNYGGLQTLKNYGQITLTLSTIQTRKIIFSYYNIFSSRQRYSFQMLAYSFRFVFSTLFSPCSGLSPVLDILILFINHCWHNRETPAFANCE